MTFKVTIKNDFPLKSVTIPNVVSHLGSSFESVIQPNAFTDSENDYLTVSAALTDGTALPSFIIFDPAIKRFYGTALLQSLVSVYNIRVTATDSINTVKATSDFTISITNVAPVPKAASMTA
jgi:hypothetical protein